MSFAFAARGGPIIVEASLSGPTGHADLRLLLDTAATNSLVRTSHLIAAGYDLNASANRAKVVMGNGELVAPRVTLNRLSALGRHHLGLVVVAHDLPESTRIDGLLGLDFLRDLRLTIDFRAGQISLE